MDCLEEQEAQQEAASAVQVAVEGVAARHAVAEAAWKRQEATLLQRVQELQSHLASESQVPFPARGHSARPCALPVKLHVGACSKPAESFPISTLAGYGRSELLGLGVGRLHGGMLHSDSQSFCRWVMNGGGCTGAGAVRGGTHEV